MHGSDPPEAEPEAETGPGAVPVEEKAQLDAETLEEGKDKRGKQRKAKAVGGLVKKVSILHFSEGSRNRPGFGRKDLCLMPRSCHVHISRLVLLENLSTSVGYFTIAVRIRGQKLKNMLRSQPIPVAKNKSRLMDVSLDLWFECEYVHHIKVPPGNKPDRLQILLEKPHRNFPGLNKTLAVAHVHLDRVLQCPVDDLVDLETPVPILEFDKSKKGTKVARIKIQVSTLPVDPRGRERRARGVETVKVVDDDAGLPSDEESPPTSEAEVKDEQYRSGSDQDAGAEAENEVDEDETFKASVALKKEKFREKTEKFVESLKQSGRRWLARMKQHGRGGNVGTRSIGAHTAAGAAAARSDSKTDGRPEELAGGMAGLAEGQGDLSISRERSEALDVYPDVPLEALIKSYPPVEAQLAELFMQSPRGFPAHVLLADAESRKGRRLIIWAEHSHAFSEVLRNLVVIKGAADAKSAFHTIVSRFKQQVTQQSNRYDRELCIALAGGDHVISHILEPYLSLVSRERQGWRNLRFFVIPLGEEPHDNKVASWLAMQDSVYRALFFSSDWQQAFAREARFWIDAEGERVEVAINRYLDDARNVVKLPIAEALIDLVRATPSGSTNADSTASPLHAASATLGRHQGGGLDARTIPFITDIQVVLAGEVSTRGAGVASGVGSLQSPAYHQAVGHKAVPHTIASNLADSGGHSGGETSGDADDDTGHAASDDDSAHGGTLRHYYVQPRHQRRSSDRTPTEHDSDAGRNPLTVHEQARTKAPHRFPSAGPYASRSAEVDLLREEGKTTGKDLHFLRSGSLPNVLSHDASASEEGLAAPTLPQSGKEDESAPSSTATVDAAGSATPTSPRSARLHRIKDLFKKDKGGKESKTKLQIDYWTVERARKMTLKANFKVVCISRLDAFIEIEGFGVGGSGGEEGAHGGDDTEHADASGWLSSFDRDREAVLDAELDADMLSGDPALSGGHELFPAAGSSTDVGVPSSSGGVAPSGQMPSLMLGRAAMDLPASVGAEGGNSTAAASVLSSPSPAGPPAGSPARLTPQEASSTLPHSSAASAHAVSGTGPGIGAGGVSAAGSPALTAPDAAEFAASSMLPPGGLLLPQARLFTEPTRQQGPSAAASLCLRALTVKGYEKSLKQMKQTKHHKPRERTGEALSSSDVRVSGVSKVIVSSLNYESRFAVEIDGVFWQDVNFVSISPQWPGRVKALPVASFVNDAASTT